MLLFLYQIFIYFIQPIIWIRLLWRGLKSPSYFKRLGERYGFYSKKVIAHGILLHAVSVGEAAAAIPLVKILRYNYPKLPIIITTMTPTGSEFVLSALGDDVDHVYLPYDLCWAMRRFLNYANPKLAIFMETELWPNLILELKKRKIPLIIANARLSERSAMRYQQLGYFVQMLLKNITLVAAQSIEDGEHFIKLGLVRKKLHVTGNLKFDISITPEMSIKIIALRQQWAPHRPVWIATSVHKGEESVILNVHAKLLKQFPSLLLILVPRHPEYFTKIKKLTQKAKLRYISRTEKLVPHIDIQVVIGDTIGELMLLYGIADIAFIGGSLINKGGHNPLEAAVHALPILMGPYTFNFKDICAKLKQANSLITVNNSKSLYLAIYRLLKYKDCRLHYGQQAAEVLYKNQGASKKLLKILELYCHL